MNGAMNFGQLNLDSDGVFTIVNEQAQKAGVSFDHVDYTLQSGPAGGVPVWRVELFEGSHGRVALLEIAADAGNEMAAIQYASGMPFIGMTEADLIAHPEQILEWRQNSVRYLTNAAENGNADAMYALSDAFESSPAT